jgi:hypothetical protein
VDPLSNIEEQTSLARVILERIDEDADEHGRLGLWTAEHVADLAGQLAERVIALDRWRRSGGFDPYG